MSIKKQYKTRRQAKDCEQIERRRMAISMRKDAFTLREIALKLGVSIETARKDIQYAMEELRRDMLMDAQSYRAIQVARHEEIVNRHKPIALDPSAENCYNSAGVLYRAEQQLSKLVGSESPVESKNININHETEPKTLKLEILPTKKGSDSAILYNKNVGDNNEDTKSSDVGDSGSSE